MIQDKEKESRFKAIPNPSAPVTEDAKASIVSGISSAFTYPIDKKPTALIQDKDSKYKAIPNPSAPITEDAK